MPVEPKIPKQTKTLMLKKCARCGGSFGEENFARTHSHFYSDGFLPICNSCITDDLKKANFSWEAADKVCQWADIPFIVKEWERLKELNTEENLFAVYAKVFAADEYKSLGWGDYFNQYKKLREAGMIEEELPLIKEKHLAELRKRWGSNYDEEELNYLEDLYKGLLISQNVNGALQIDQAQKLCKISLEIDSRIRAGDKDVDKFLGSYDKLVKTAEFTPKNTKNAADFDSIAELAFWLEKRGNQNKFYDNVTRDVIDETLKNIENWNQRLYVNEGGIGEEINQRLKSLQNAQEVENFYGTQKDFDSDEYDNGGYAIDEDEEFEVET